MSTTSLDDLGKLVLRLTLGILILLHGISKLLGGVGGIEGMLVAQGLPAFFAWGAYIGEVVAPLLLIFGIYTRLGGLLIVANMVVAIMLAHTKELFTLAGSGGWSLELQGMFLATGLAIALLGAGRYSVGGRGGKWN
jgi:putative oxidoreductase